MYRCRNSSHPCIQQRSVITTREPYHFPYVVHQNGLQQRVSGISFFVLRFIPIQKRRVEDRIPMRTVRSHFPSLFLGTVECTNAMNACRDILSWFAGSVALSNNFFGKHMDQGCFSRLHIWCASTHLFSARSTRHIYLHMTCSAPTSKPLSWHILDGIFSIERFAPRSHFHILLRC